MNEQEFAAAEARIDQDSALENLQSMVTILKGTAEHCFACGVSPMTIFETITETLGIEIPAPFMLVAKRMAESAVQSHSAKGLAPAAAPADTLG